MKGIRKYWSRQSFTKQISVVFILLFTAQIVFLAGISNTYLTDIIEKKIIGFFRIAVEQAASNIAATLNGYEEAVNQMTIDEKFLDYMQQFEEARGQEELGVKQELRKQYASRMPEIIQL